MTNLENEDGDLEIQEVPKREGSFSQPCGFSKESKEVGAFVKDPNGDERAIYELMQNLFDHMKDEGKVLLIDENGAIQDFTGTEEELETQRGIAFVDDGPGINPDHFLAHGSFKADPDKSLGQRGKGLKIASAYMVCSRGLSLSVDAVENGQEWEAQLVEQKTGHGGPVPLLHLNGQWKTAAPAGKKGTRLVVWNPDSKFLKALVNMPKMFLYANPYYKDAKLVKSLCPKDCDFPEYEIPPGKVQCLIGLKGEGEWISSLEKKGIQKGPLPNQLYENVYVDGLALPILRFNNESALLPWAIEGLGGADQDYYRQVRRSHDSTAIEGGGLSKVVTRAVRNLTQRSLLKNLIERAVALNSKKTSFIEFSGDSYSLSRMAPVTQELVQSIFRELHGTAKIGLSADEKRTYEGETLVLEDKGLFDFLKDAGVPVNENIKSKEIVVEKSERVSFAKSPDALEKLAELVARLEGATCDLREYKGKGVLRFSIPASVEVERVLYSTENHLAQALNSAAAVAGCLSIPLRVLYSKDGETVELKPKQVTNDHPCYYINWDLKTMAQPHTDLEQGKVHILFGGERMDFLYQVSKLGKHEPKTIEVNGARSEWEKLLETFMKTAREVQARIRKIGKFSLRSIPPTGTEGTFNLESLPYCRGEYEERESYSASNISSLIETAGLEIADLEIADLTREGPRMKNGIDLQESVLSPGFYTSIILSKPVLSNGQLVWRNKEVQHETVDVLDEVPKEWKSKVVLRNLRPGYKALPMRDYDTLLAVTETSDELEIHKDFGTGMFYVLVPASGLEKLTYYTGISPSRQKTPPVELDDQEDCLSYESLDTRWREIILKIRQKNSRNYIKRARMAQAAWGKGFVYAERWQINEGVRAENVEESASKHLNNQTGNCAYAATGAALLYRAVGVPTQFLGGFEVDTLGMSEEGHAKIKFWDGDKWVIQEPQAGCTQYETSSQNRRIMVNSKIMVNSNKAKGERERESPAIEEESLSSTILKYRRGILAGLLSAGLISMASFEILQSGAATKVLEEIAEQVSLKGLSPSTVDSIRNEVKKAVCVDEESP